MEFYYQIDDVAKELSLEDYNAISGYLSGGPPEKVLTYNEYLDKPQISFHFKLVRRALDSALEAYAIEEMRTNPSMQEVEDRY